MELLQFGKRKLPRGVRTLHNQNEVKMPKLHLLAAATLQPPPCVVVMDAQQTALVPGQLAASADDPVESGSRLPAQGTTSPMRQDAEAAVMSCENALRTNAVFEMLGLTGASSRAGPGKCLCLKKEGDASEP